MFYNSAKDPRKVYCATIDVLECNILSVGDSFPTDLHLVDEFIMKEDGIVTSHTITFHSDNLTSLILKVSDYVRNAQNEAEQVR